MIPAPRKRDLIGFVVNKSRESRTSERAWEQEERTNTNERMHLNYHAVLRIEISRVTCELIEPFIVTAGGGTRRRNTTRSTVLNGATGRNEERIERGKRRNEKRELS